MTDDKTKGGSPLDFSDLEDALADWERELDSGSGVRPEAAPLPHTAKHDVRAIPPPPRPAAPPIAPKAPAAPISSGSEPRPFYRPPSPDDVKQMEAARQRRAVEDFSIDFDDDGDDGATKIAQIPMELIEQLQRAQAAAPPPATTPKRIEPTKPESSASNTSETVPPPAGTSSTVPPPSNTSVTMPPPAGAVAAGANSTVPPPPSDDDDALLSIDLDADLDSLLPSTSEAPPPSPFVRPASAVAPAAPAAPTPPTRPSDRPTVPHDWDLDATVFGDVPAAVPPPDERPTLLLPDEPGLPAAIEAPARSAAVPPMAAPLPGAPTSPLASLLDDDLSIFDEPTGAKPASDEPASVIPGDDDEPEVATTIDADDDEPAIVIPGDDDDDEPEIATTIDADDDEPAIVFPGDDDDDDEPEVATTIDADDDEPLLDVEDAPVARKSFAYPKADRAEPLPLVGRSFEALRARKAMLLELANRAAGAGRADLLVAAAELSERAGDDDAASLYDEAISVDPTHVIALRASRRLALLRHDVETARARVAAEVALPVTDEEKALLLLLEAELDLHERHDATAAEKAAKVAASTRKTSPIASLLFAETLTAIGKGVEASMALERAAHATADARVEGAWLAWLALSEETAGRATRARALFARAAEASPDAIDAVIGAIRTTRRDAETKAASIARLDSVEAALSTPALVEDVRRAHANLLLHALGKPEDALARLEGAKSALSLSTRAEAARATGDRDAERNAVVAWAEVATSTDRALALLRLAELEVEAGALEAANEALRNAALADPKLVLVRVVRELLARRAGDSSRLESTALSESDATGEGALARAARVAFVGGSKADERAALERAIGEGEGALAADVLGLDVAAAGDDRDAVALALARVAERGSGTARTAAWLARAFQALGANQLVDAESALAKAFESSPDDPVVGEPLARFLAARDPAAARELFEQLARSTEGEVSAFYATEAARLAGDAGVADCQSALEADPRYAPAAWRLARLAATTADAALANEAARRLSALAEDPTERAAYAVARLDRAHPDLAVLDEWAAALADDPVLLEGLSTHPDATDERRADALARLGDLATGEASIAFANLAATLRRLAGDAQAAAAARRDVLANHPNDVVTAFSLLRDELAANELARTTERLFQVARTAPDDAARARALLALAELDEHERGDAGTAILTLAGVRELFPHHLPTLRKLERHAMGSDASAELLDAELALLESVTAEPDVSAHARMAARLRLATVPDVPGAADPILRSALERGTKSRRLLQMIEGAAFSAQDRATALEAERRLLDTTTDPSERLALALRIAEHLDVLEGPGAAARALKEAADAAPSHPTAYEALGVYLERAGDAHSAAESFALAGGNARVRERAASLYHRAGVLWQDGARDLDQALACFDKVVAIDVSFLDTFDRAEAILRKRDNHAGLVALYDARIAFGGDPALLAALHGRRAALAEQIGDRSDAREALRRSLELAPDDVETLKKYAELSLQDEDHRTAAEALIRIARVRQDRDELRWVFMTLGDIYDVHLPDPRRAEAAFRRVLKLVPTDREALERLAKLFVRTAQLPEAVTIIDELLRLAPTDPRIRPIRLSLADGFERAGDLRQAEATLDALRRERPTDTHVVSAMAEFYKRQNAQSALSMHLNRAIADYRKAIDERPGDNSLWHGLAQMHTLRGRNDAARATASAAFSVGIVDAELARHLDATGSVPGAGKAAASAELDELLVSRLLSPAALQVMKLASEVFEKTLPFDPKPWRAEKLPKDHPMRAEAQRIGQWFGLSEVQILVTGAAPRICVPVSDHPVTLVVGRELTTAIKDQARTFLLVRAIKVAASGLSVALRTQPGMLALALHGLVRCFDPSHAPEGLDGAQLDEMAKRLTKNLGRKAKTDLGPLAIEMSGRQGFDAQRLGLAAAELGNRAALLATGSPATGILALLELAGRQIPENASPAQRSAAVRAMPEAWALVQFAISDPYFDARQKSGADRG